jgi:hypothetical protein
MNSFKKVARSIYNSFQARVAVEDKDEEWQRVNSAIADVLRDAHVLYAKLARLQNDFKGDELQGLQTIGENVLTIGGKLSEFSKAFYEGKLAMSDAEKAMGQIPDPFGTTDDMAPSPSDMEMPSMEPAEGGEEVEFDYSQLSSDDSEEVEEVAEDTEEDTEEEPSEDEEEDEEEKEESKD